MTADEYERRRYQRRIRRRARESRLQSDLVLAEARFSYIDMLLDELAGATLYMLDIADGTVRQGVESIWNDDVGWHYVAVPPYDIHAALAHWPRYLGSQYDET